MEKHGDRSKAVALRQKADELLKKKPLKHNSQLSEVENLKLIYELEVHQVELELQNEELLNAQAVAEAANDKYIRLYDLAPSGYFTLSREGGIVELNLTGALMLGKDRMHLMSKMFAFFVSPATRPIFNLFLEKVFKNNIKESCEVNLAASGNQPVYVHLSGIATECGKQCFVTAVDITERHQMEFALQQSEGKYLQLAESSTTLVYRVLLKPELKFDYVSPSATVITGYTPEDHYSDPFLGFKLVHPDDRILLENTTKYSKGEPLELRWIKKDGQIIWTEQRNVLLCDKNNEPYAIEGNAIDITDRKNAELRLLKEVERTSLLLDLFAKAPALPDKELYDRALDIAVKITDSKIGFFHQVSGDQQEIILVTWNEEAKKNCTTVHDNHYHLDKAGNWADCIRQKKPVVYNDYTTSPNKKGLPEGHSPIGRTLSIPVVHEEKVRLIFGVGNKSTDYTDLDVIQIQAIANELHKILEKRKVENDLKKSEDRWHFAIEGSNDGIWDWNILTSEVFFSNRWKEMIGHGHDELEGKLGEWQSRVHPDDIEEVLFKLKQHFEQKTPDYTSEHRILCKDGSWKWILDRGKVMEWAAEGKPTRMVGTQTDIAQRKIAEENIRKSEIRLRESEEKFRNITEQTADLIAITDTKGVITYASPSSASLFLISPEDMCGRNFTEFVAESDRDRAFKEFRNCTEGDCKVKDAEFKLKRTDSSVFTGELNGSKFSTHAQSGALVIIRDIDERQKAEDKLIQSEAALNYSQEIAKMGSWEFDLITGKVSWSKGYYLLVGQQPDGNEIPNGAFDKMVHPSDKHLIDENLKEIYQNRKPASFDMRLILPNGQVKWVQNNIVPVFDGDTLIALKGVNIDITEKKLAVQEIGKLNNDLESRIKERTAQLAETNENLLREIKERKQAEETLQMNEAKYRALIESTGTGYLILDWKGLVIDANSEYVRMSGHKDLSEILGRSETEWTAEYEKHKNMEAVAKCIREGQLRNLEIDYIDNTGRVTAIEINARFEGKGEKARIIAICQDITDRKQVEDTLKKLSTRLSLAVRAGGVGVWDYDIVSNILEWDDQMFELYGIEKKDFNGAFNAWQSRLHPEDKERGNVEIQMAIRGEKDFDTEFRVVRSDGSVHNIRALAIVRYDSSGKPLNIIGTNWDITSQKHAEAEINKSREEAENANRAKSEFLSRMSHELRTPMNSILGFAQLMEMGDLNPKQKRGVAHILNNGRHLLSLINEVLDIAGIESGKQLLAMEPVQLDGLINGITDSIEFAANKRKIFVQFVDSPANSLFALADKVRIRQVLINLLSNAIKYNNEGGSVTIKTAVQPTDEKGNTKVRISISDTGQGIRPEDIGKLFQPFERIGADRTDTEGTGLGLMVVKKLTEAMGGTVGVDSVVGTGSTFWIELELTEDHKPVISQTTVAPTQELQATKQTGTILYIEDNLSNIELVEEIMVEHHPGILLVASIYGKETVKLAKEHNPGLLLLDLDLPDINGLEVLEQLLADPITRSIPVIIISADAMPFQVEKLMKAGAQDYLTKPLNVVQFVRTIDWHFKSR